MWLWRDFIRLFVVIVKLMLNLDFWVKFIMFLGAKYRDNKERVGSIRKLLPDEQASGCLHVAVTRKGVGKEGEPKRRRWVGTAYERGGGKKGGGELWGEEKKDKS